MVPTIRERLAGVLRLVRGLMPRPAPRRPASAKPQLSSLEAREMPAFSVSLSAVPNLIWPANGRYIEVVVSGTFKEYTIENNKVVFKQLPGAKQADYQVIDEYRQVEPRGPVQLYNAGGGVYDVSFPVYLPASRSTEYAAGRRYYIIVGAKDSDAWSGLTLPVQIPISPTNRGPGPQVPTPVVNNLLANPPKPHHHK